jgi:hypothetical protein
MPRVAELVAEGDPGQADEEGCVSEAEPALDCAARIIENQHSSELLPRWHFHAERLLSSTRHHFRRRVERCSSCRTRFALCNRGLLLGFSGIGFCSSEHAFRLGCLGLHPSKC